jgi:TonB family protein
MSRTILALALIFCIAGGCGIAPAGAEDPPPAIIDSPPSGDEPKFGEYVYVDELPEAIVKPAAIYPEAARRAGVNGTVMVQALVGKNGLVKETRVIRSIPLLDSAAVAAVRAWKFKPALSNHQPVSVWVAVPMRFDIAGVPASGGATTQPLPARPVEPGERPSPPPGQGAPEPGRPVEKPLIDAFNARLAAAGDSAWAKAPATIAIEFVGGADCQCTRFSVEVGNQPERFDESEVTVTRDGFLDDSIGGDRHRLSMRRGGDGIWRLASATVAWRCQSGRGHEGYSPDPCN